MPTKKDLEKEIRLLREELEALRAYVHALPVQTPVVPATPQPYRYPYDVYYGPYCNGSDSGKPFFLQLNETTS